METEIADALRGCRTDGRDFRRSDFARVVIKLVKYLEKRVDAIGTGKHDPVILVRVLHEFGEFAQVGWRLDSNRRQLKDVGADRTSSTGRSRRTPFAIISRAIASILSTPINITCVPPSFANAA